VEPPPTSTFSMSVAYRDGPMTPKLIATHLNPLANTDTGTTSSRRGKTVTEPHL
jgi:hypothetical protein